jgi:LuxR family maltose regulon positive regulatory protein
MGLDRPEPAAEPPPWPQQRRKSPAEGAAGLPYRAAASHAVAMGRRAKSAEPPFFPFVPVRNPVFNELAAQGHPGSKVISITAPTGYGKTVLLSALHQHYARAGTDCRWTALDDRDAGVERLLLHLESALIDPGAEVNVMEAIHEGDEPIDERIERLIESLKLLRGPVAVFIDNLNCCTDESLRQLLDTLIFRTPSWVHFLLSSTSSLPFNQSRAKLEGLLRSVGFSELSLTGGEIRGLLGPDLCGRLPDAAIAQIERQTEGWPAAIRLMQIILSASADPAGALKNFSGADEDLAALLHRQVLQGFDAPSRKFLLETSLLRSFGVNLCQHTTGEERAAAYVGRLLSQNVFVIPLDRNRSWYRLHALFREFLLDEAQRQIPEERRQQILSRAAEWCEHAGLWQEAIEYALEAGSAPLTAAILDRVAAMFVRDRGDLRQYIEWVEKLHATGADCGFEADFWYAWALVFHRRYEYARKQLRRLSGRLQQAGESLPKGEAAALRRRCDIIAIAIGIYTDHTTEAYTQAAAWV